jgi:hypothetical protein
MFPGYDSQHQGEKTLDIFSRNEKINMTYTIEEHKHRFASWAAGSAASVKGCRFKVEQGKKILEETNLNKIARHIDNLPVSEEFDRYHREWRKNIINEAKKHKGKNGEFLQFTHGVAAKLINVYLKSIFVCSDCNEEIKVKAIHPPIDSVLLKTLYQQNINELRNEWQAARKVGWSKLDSIQYENVISAIKKTITNGNGLWQIEEYWQGFQ